MSPAIAATGVRTAAVESFAAFMAHGADPPAGLWCIGQMAPAPCPQMQVAACGSVALIHKPIGTSVTVPTWHNNQIAVSGPSRRRICVINWTR